MPSIGSTTQRTPLLPDRAAPSSPRTPSSGRAASSRPTISSSLARSTAVTTSTELDLTSTRSPAEARPSATSSAASRAVSTARASRAAGSGRSGRSRPRSCRSPRARPLSRRPGGPGRRLAPSLRGGASDEAFSSWGARGSADYPVACRASAWTSVAAASRGAWSTSSGPAIGERLRIETPQPSAPERGLRRGGPDRGPLRLDRADRRDLPRGHEARRRLHRGQRRQELDRHRRRRRAGPADPRHGRDAQRRRRGRHRRDALRRGARPAAASC